MQDWRSERNNNLELLGFHLDTLTHRRARRATPESGFLVPLKERRKLRGQNQWLNRCKRPGYRLCSTSAVYSKDSVLIGLLERSLFRLAVGCISVHREF